MIVSVSVPGNCQHTSVKSAVAGLVAHHLAIGTDVLTLDNRDI